MTPLERQLHSRITAEGPLSFAEFMKVALYDREFGYYGAGKAAIGREGDFYTSVSVGPLFGRLLARQFTQMWEILGKPAKWTLVEQGAFNGQLAFDVLEALQIQSPQCFEVTELLIIEPFEAFQKKQAEKLAAFQTRISWVQDPSDLPVFTGVHYSNELLDAFPVHRIQRGNSQWHELRVGIENTELAWCPSPITDADLLERSQALPELPTGFCMELGFSHKPWLKTIFEKLSQGWLLTFDYGMSAEELALPHRKDGTLAAYRNHKREENPLKSPGESDLTAHVNFTDIATDALANGWEIEGYTDQHRFFTGLAPLHFQDQSEAMTVQDQKERLAFRSLTHPQMMGVQFKAFCLKKKISSKTPLAGLTFARPAEITLGLAPIS